MKPMDIIFTGALMVIAGGIVGAFGTRMQNKASSAKSDKQLAKIEELNSQNARMANSISTLSEQNGKLMIELAEARKEVSRANQQTIDNTFGSKAILFVNGTTFGKLYNESELPAYDVKIFVTDYDELLKCPIEKDKFGLLSISGDCYHKNTKQYSSQIIYGFTEMDLTDFKIDNLKPFKIVTKFITKKGTYYQQSLNDPKLGFAYRILEQTNIEEHYKQFLDYSTNKDLVIKPKDFIVTKEVNKRDKAVNWEAEFPIPVSFNLY